MLSQLKNLTGVRAYKKAGFKELGWRRLCHRSGGELHDEIFMQCLSDEFERPVTAGKQWGFSTWLPPEGTARIEAGTGCGGPGAVRRTTGEASSARSG